MNTNPLVSIIVNNYNYARFIRDAIDSALYQTYTRVEVIVVDDGSTDDSPGIIMEYGNQITVILKQNGGQASALNAGFNVSNGEIIVFLDSDDILLPAAIERAVELFSTADVSKVQWKMWIVNSAGEKSGRVMPQHALATGNLKEEIMLYGPNHSAAHPTVHQPVVLHGHVSI